MKTDLRFPLLVLLLTGVGLLTVSTASLSPRVPDGLLLRQVTGLALSLVVVAGIWWVGRDRIYRAAPALFLLALILQAATFVVGRDINGQRNWLVLGPIQFQPLELLKLALVPMLALALRRGYEGWRTYARALLIFLPALGLVITQDFGGAIILTGMFAAMLLTVRPPVWHALLAVVVLGVGFPALVYPRLEPYQQQRLTIFLNPYQDARGAGYQVIQSMVAVGSGGVQGKGYREGSQAHNGFVPEPHTDFAFSTWAEEQGFIGAAALLALYGLLFWSLAGMATQTPRLQDQILFAGVLSQVGWQVLENVGAALSLLPLTGITLPLVSYGLSSLGSTLALLAMAYTVHRDRYW